MPGNQGTYSGVDGFDLDLTSESFPYDLSRRPNTPGNSMIPRRLDVITLIAGSSGSISLTLLKSNGNARPFYCEKGTRLDYQITHITARTNIAIVRLYY